MQVPPSRPVRSSNGQRITLPTRVVLYTIDQLSAILNIDETTLMQRYLYYKGLSSGLRGKRMEAVNIEPDETQKARWRVAETELVRYLVERGFRIEGYRI
jgi:hypothetical protein